MNKKSLILFAVLMLTLVTGSLLAGCGKSADVNSIKIGLLNEMTGGNATFGTSSANGAKMAFKEINAKGGVLGKQILAVIADNKSEPSESANAMTKLATQDGVLAVTGVFASSNAIAASSVAEATKTPFLAVGATNPKVTVDEKTKKVKDYTFRVCFIDPFQGTVGANFVLNTLKVKKAVILVDNSSDYSKGLSAFFREAFTKGGGSILTEEAYLQKDQDFKAVLTKVKALNAEVIYVPGYYEEVGKIVKQAREMGITAPIVGGDGWDSPKLVELGGAPALNNTYFTNHYSVEDSSPASKAFVDHFGRCLRTELVGTKVRLTNIAPGKTRSEFALVQCAGDQSLADRAYSSLTPLEPMDVANSVLWALQQPQHVNINSIELMPADQELSYR